ncbi:cleavage and polyadenylation specificity factor subunit 6 [Impatiens glandulifera]|uniref:cleavage and polyadenylation specificity factor subunit 6 n=1 Tax=Impatiens glandulifera TaxID=253017 RepID=UPI001FB13E51|nr:cleavage and polyadenylation specificity factor subunit 6 [Impatiens glandulifera]XP_047334631.1 cleavage and polyadenylation specificity factor subunit 6 [Impatiens glandulifera]XP_047334632.1 cleavage and polyadenylation specificity factor subunit 6 [Impatiens glandulifera]XP_047334633.1 cleavage and polyadenylation specificity factor subunit 6 [Impatiens glandulifera]
MEENESAGDVGDVSEQFNSTEAIAAVADDGFLHGEEDDEDYEDLYNDVNVGEGFHNSLGKDEEDLGFTDNTINNVVDNKIEPSQIAAESTALIPGVVGVVDGSRVSGIQGEDQSTNTGGGMRFQLLQSSDKTDDFHEQQQHLVDKSIRIQAPNLQLSQSVNAGTVNGVESGFGTGPGSILPQPQAVLGSVGTSLGPVLFVGDLHWWTTDSELETELCKYGSVKEIKFFDEKASGKSKGYCQVEFYDPSSAIACKEGMNGHLFNGRPCLVAHASPFTVKKMGEAQVNRNQANPSAVAQRRGPGMVMAPGPGTGDPAPGKMVNQTGGGSFQGGVGENNRGGYGRGNWGRSGPHGLAGRGPTGPMRNRPGGIGGRGMMGGYGPGPPLMHAQAMMGQGYDHPGYGGPMGRMGGYGGFPGGPTAPFSGILSSFPPVGNVGLPGVAPHVNPAFFGRGMPMGMVPSAGVDPNMGMWADPNMSGWAGDDYGGGRAAGGDSSYGEEAAESWQNPAKEKAAAPPPEKDWSGSTERRYRDEREADFEREKDTGHENDFSERRRGGGDRERDRDRIRERSRDRDRNRDREREKERERGDRHRGDDRERHDSSSRYKERESERGGDDDDEWKRSSRSTRPQSKSRMSHEDDQRSSRSRDTDYAKRRH